MDILEYIQAANTTKLLPEKSSQIQDISRKSKVLPIPWISLECLESSSFVGFSGESLQKEIHVEIS